LIQRRAGGTDRSPSTMGCKLRTFGRLLGRQEGESMVRGARCIGSAALNFCAVAAGQLDLFWEIGAWEWVRSSLNLAVSLFAGPLLTWLLPACFRQDVCGGTAIALEAGAHLFGSKDRALDAPLDGALLQGRKYLIIRALPDGIEGQRRLAGQFLKQVEEWDQ
jgi:myo-inositol-1(or 4)-monophosphatase